MKKYFQISITFCFLLSALYSNGQRREIKWANAMLDEAANTFAGWNASGDATALTSTQAATALQSHFWRVTGNTTLTGSANIDGAQPVAFGGLTPLTGFSVAVTSAGDISFAGNDTNADATALLFGSTYSYNFRLQKEHSSTNSVIYPISFRRTSSGAPATGIGLGFGFEVETAANNVETGATIETVTTDVTSTSEDFDLVFKTMAAGAAASEKFRIKSTGIIEYKATNNSLFVDPATQNFYATKLSTTTDDLMAIQAATGVVGSVNGDHIFISGGNATVNGNGGNIFLTPGAGNGTGIRGNVLINTVNGTLGTWGGMAGGIYVEEAAANAAANPVDGFLLYSNASDGSKPYVRLPSGDVYSTTNTQLDITIANTSTAIGTHPNSEQQLQNANTSRTQVETTYFNYIRLVGRVSVGSTSANDPRLYIQYTTDLTGAAGWTTIGDGTTAGNDAFDLTDVGNDYTDWLTLPAAAKADVLYRIAQNGGDGAASPTVVNLHIQFK
jgi:hypothetical protein